MSKANGRYRIEYVDPASLREWERNPRAHPPESVAAIKKSILAHGFRNPIIARREDRRVEAGHGRLMAARELGLKEVPVIFVEGDDELKAASFAVADNRSQELSSFVPSRLADVLLELDAANRLDDALFTPLELQNLAHGLDEWQPPDPPEAWKEFDESAADGFETVTCPYCGKEFVHETGKD
jgi:ParB-like chromosome segregation protein Spo0J